MTSDFRGPSAAEYLRSCMWSATTLFFLVHLHFPDSPQSNPENTVGVLTMAGKSVRVLVTPTADLGKILSCMHGTLHEHHVKVDESVFCTVWPAPEERATALQLIL